MISTRNLASLTTKADGSGSNGTLNDFEMAIMYCSISFFGGAATPIFIKTCKEKQFHSVHIIII